MSHVYPARPRRSPAALAALDFGLRVRVDSRPAQRTIFHSAAELPVQELTAELSLMVSELRVRSFALRYELEQLTEALAVNVRCGFWPLARRAGVDLGDLLSLSRKRRLADAALCIRGANCAFRIAELCAKEVR